MTPRGRPGRLLRPGRPQQAVIYLATDPARRVETSDHVAHLHE
ncbi:hypothetical protein N136_03358 [Leifsonia aquatica ATCC 14665]|uniref:Uncharacterized protein n=1 Tax=Leifsonia aquatica ATCC 14665 TaxID=1358026 RepID=U2T6G7_LEIAQ|nr:hypothetical protein N136_03358 [Leifsonia aquatica ATCC 14665]